jgi:hypothetical protein
MQLSDRSGHRSHLKGADGKKSCVDYSPSGVNFHQPTRAVQSIGSHELDHCYSPSILPSRTRNNTHISHPENIETNGQFRPSLTRHVHTRTGVLVRSLSLLMVKRVCFSVHPAFDPSPSYPSFSLKESSGESGNTRLLADTTCLAPGSKPSGLRWKRP